MPDDVEPWWEIGSDDGPDVPCPTFGGRPVVWDSWEIGPLLTHGWSACECGRDPVHHAVGTVHPLPGDTVELVRNKTLRSGRIYGKPYEAPAWPLRRLWASFCPGCRDFTIHEFVDPKVMPTLEALLCDGCDDPCAFGSTTEEARASLVAIGGWTAGAAADWDLCRRCNPNRAAEPTKVTPLRARG
jgi:hypothetical protein